MPHTRWLSLLALLLLVPATASAQTSDTTPPQLVAFDFNPKSIDVTAVPQDVTVTARVTDDLSGAPYGVYVTFRSPSGLQSHSVFLYQTGGSALDATYAGTISIPQYVESGTWQADVWMEDVVGNDLSLGAANLAALGFPVSLDVVSTPDTIGPVVEGAVFSPLVIDVSSADQVITFDVHLTDNVSGVDVDGWPNWFLASLGSPSEPSRYIIPYSDFTLISGTPLDGHWQLLWTIPRYSEAGTWHLFMNLRDNAGNSSYVDAGTFDVTSTMQDLAAPTLTGLRFTPAVIDTSVGPATVTVSLDLTDDLSGVDLSLESPHGGWFHGMEFQSPSMAQWRGACCDQFTMTSGTVLNGTWEASIYFPQYSEAGTWKAWVAQVTDRVRNSLNLGPDALAAASFPTDLVVVRPSLVGDGTVDAGGGTVTDETYGDRAALTFPPDFVSTLTEVAIDVFPDPLAIPTPVGFQGPGTYFVNVKLTPEPAYPFPDPGVTATLPLPGFLAPGTALPLFFVDTATGLLEPMPNATSGLQVVGTVNPDGLSATFAGISHFSILVGLVPDRQPPEITCAAADGLWHAGEVSLSCTAQDTGSGLANPGDASFTLTANVAEGQESANVSSNSRSVCDVAGNCATAGPIPGNMIDRKAPVLTPPADQTVKQTEAGGAVVSYPAATATDGGSGVASLTCLPDSGTLFPVGTTTVTCTAVDVVGHTATATFSVTVTPTGTNGDGLIFGAGHVDDGKVHHHFVFRVAQRGSREYGRIEYWATNPRSCDPDDRNDAGHDIDGRHDFDYGRDHRGPRSHFRSATVDSIVFSDDPRFGPGGGRRAAATVDSVIFSGTGWWSGKPGYSFEAAATDQGEPGRGRDTFWLMVRDASGKVVASVSGVLAGGNIQSARVGR